MNTHFAPSLLALAASLFACSTASAALPAFDGYAAASDADLDAMRGGFEVNFNGMQLLLAFSIEQLTYVNGELVSSMRLTPLQLNPATPPQSSPVASTPPAGNASPPIVTAQSGITPTTVTTQLVNNQGVLTLVQNGTGNAFALPQSLASLTTVIQNTVNDQVIRNLTVLNATLSIQQAAAAMRLSTALNQAIAAGLR